MSETGKYVSINGERSNGVFEWAHRPRSVWYGQVGPLVVLGAGFGGLMGALLADAEEGPMVLWSIIGGLIGGFLVGCLAFYMAAARMELKRGVLRLSTGQKKLDAPMGAIAYIGKAEFTRRNRWRLSRTNFIVEPGPGIEIYSRDRKYITVSTPHADALFEALLSQGLHPDTLRVPFPENTVSGAKAPAWREQRGAPVGR